MSQQDLTVTHRGVPISVARPQGAPTAALVLLQEIFGVNDHIKEVARRFAAEGYVVAAPHLFHRLPTQQFDYSDPAAKQTLGQLKPPEVLSDIRAAVSWLASDGGAPGIPVGTVGFCFGGRASFLAATAVDGLFACVAFYGAGIAADGDPDAPIHRAAAITCPVLAVYGAEDPVIPADEVRRVDAALEAAGVRHEVHTYARAGHAFFNDARAANHDATAARDAWRRTLGFLSEAVADYR